MPKFSFSNYRMLHQTDLVKGRVDFEGRRCTHVRRVARLSPAAPELDADVRGPVVIAVGRVAGSVLTVDVLLPPLLLALAGVESRTRLDQTDSALLRLLVDLGVRLFVAV